MRNWRDRMVFATAVVLAGLALRPTLAAVGPLLEDIQRDTGLSDVTAGMLTTLPVALMGACMFGSVRMRAWLGERSGIALGVLLVALCSALRWFGPGEVALVATALLGGLGIAMVQALMPRVIHRCGGTAAASLMGFYTTAIMGGAMAASALSPWVAGAAGWPVALGIWAVPAILAAVVWWISVPNEPGDQPPHAEQGRADRIRLYRYRRVWLLVVLLGLGTGAYTLVLAWLPPFYMQLGWSAEAAGAALAMVTVAEVVAGITVSVWISRFRDRRPALVTFTGLTAVGLICLATTPEVLALAAILIMGLGIGGLFPLTLITAMDHARNADEAGSVVGFVQGGGYLLAALTPLVAGALRQQLDDLTIAWWLMVGLMAVLALVAMQMKPGQDVTGR